MIFSGKALANDLTAGKVLIFAEDPGAATYLAHFPAILQNAGRDCEVLATGHALELWARNGKNCQALPPQASATDVLDLNRPSLVIVGTSENPDSFSFELTQAARTEGIKTVGVVDSAANASERFRGRGSDPLSFAPDWLIVPDQETAREFNALGFPIERVGVCGHPQYDAISALRWKWNGQDRSVMRDRWLPAAQGRPILMFVSEISTGLNPQQYRRSSAYTLEGKQENEGRTEIVLDELLLAIENLAEKPYLVLRLHPKQGWDDLAHHRLLFDQVSQAEPALEMVYSADVVVGMTSMLLHESALLGRSTLSLIPRAEERAWLGQLASAIPCVWTRQGLYRVLPEIMADSGGRIGAAVSQDAHDAITALLRRVLNER